MSCGVCGFQSSVKTPAAELAFGRARAKSPTPQAPMVVAGTWDFAWPLGKRIRVAFQHMPLDEKVSSEEFLGARNEFKARAREWQSSLLFALGQRETQRQPKMGELFEPAAAAWADALATETDDLDPFERARHLLVAQHPAAVKVLDYLADGIGFEFNGNWLFDPPLGSANSETDRNRSSFDTFEPANKPYDVLISFASLPLLNTEAFTLADTKTIAYKLPISELGSYARRTDYGEPTMYVGRFGYGRDYGLVEYLRSPLGRHVMLHEIGHALGLAHSHQNPLRTDRAGKYKDPKAAIEIMNRALGLELKADDPDDAAVLRGHLIENWPGNPEFSYWRDPDEAIERLNSVMAFPYHGCMLKVHETCTCCDDEPEGLLACAPEQLPVTPMPIDLADLMAMYYPRSLTSWAS